jgi:putative redox protein
MAQHEVVTQWMGKMQFNALVGDHTIIMDGPEKVGGENNGPIPKPFVLTALAGCTGMDVVSLLRKSNNEVQEFDIKVTGDLTNQHPIEYINIHLVYSFKGDATKQNAALEAVTASQEKFCGVSSMLKKALPVTWEINFNAVQIFNNRVNSPILQS